MADENTHNVNVKFTLSVSDAAEDNPLAVIRGITTGIKNIEVQLREAVRQARDRGHSWEEIADALGVTRQAAWERFNANIETRDDVISRAIGSLAGPGPTSDEMREQTRREEIEAEERKWGRG